MRSAIYYVKIILTLTGLAMIASCDKRLDAGDASQLEAVSNERAAVTDSALPDTGLITLDLAREQEPEVPAGDDVSDSSDPYARCDVLGAGWYCLDSHTVLECIPTVADHASPRIYDCRGVEFPSGVCPSGIHMHGNDEAAGCTTCDECVGCLSDIDLAQCGNK